MATSLKILVAAMSLAFVGSAHADCADDLAKLEENIPATQDEGISKDGSLAPLQEDAGLGQDNPAAKGDPTDQAMSGQDVEAQQEGQPVAAESAQSETDTEDRSAAISKARAALESGDEAACREALESLSKT